MFLYTISYTVFELLGTLAILRAPIFTFLKFGIVGDDEYVEYSDNDEERGCLEKDHGLLFAFLTNHLREREKRVQCSDVCNSRR